MPNPAILAPLPEETRQERGRAEDACNKAWPADTAPHPPRREALARPYDLIPADFHQEIVAAILSDHDASRLHLREVGT